MGLLANGVALPPTMTALTVLSSDTVGRGTFPPITTLVMEAWWQIVAGAKQVGPCSCSVERQMVAVVL